MPPRDRVNAINDAIKGGQGVELSKSFFHLELH